MDAAPLTMLAQSAGAQEPEGDAPGAQQGEAEVAPAAELGAQRLPCLDATHASNCTTCGPAARHHGRSRVDAARRWAVTFGRLALLTRRGLAAGAFRPPPPARRACTSSWATRAAKTVRARPAAPCRPRLSDDAVALQTPPDKPVTRGAQVRSGSSRCWPRRRSGAARPSAPHRRLNVTPRASSRSLGCCATTTPARRCASAT